MNVYEIDYQVNSLNSMVYFSEKDSSNLFRFFILGEKETYFPTKKIHSFPQSGLTDGIIKSIDFVNSVINAPIFSERLVMSLGKYLNNEIDFYPLKINEHDGFYMGRIYNELQVINYESSEYMPLGDVDDESILYEPVYLKSFDKEFFIARDCKEKTRYVVSEKFRELLINNDFDIKLKLVN